MADFEGLYVILDDRGDAARLLGLCEAVLAEGVRIVQYRAKQGINTALLASLCERTRSAGAALILNDNWQAARALGADGVHLGQEDAVGFTVAALGGKLLGRSCGSAEEALAAAAAGADYVGVGSIFATSTKRDAGEPIGLAVLRSIVERSTRPVVAIGGVTLENIEAVARTGAAMAAVVSAVADAADPRAATRALIDRWAASRARSTTADLR